MTEAGREDRPHLPSHSPTFTIILRSQATKKRLQVHFLPHAETFNIESDSKISATVPSGGRKSLAMLTVTTA